MEYKPEHWKPNQKTIKPKGIKNVIGSSCWFASMSQVIFRTVEVRDAIMNYKVDTNSVKVKDMQQQLTALYNFKEYFDWLCNPDDISYYNDKFITSLSINGKKLYSDKNMAGNDTLFAFEAFCQLFDSFSGSYSRSIRSFSNPFSPFFFMKYEKSTISVYSYILSDGRPLRNILSEQLKSIVSLPKYLIFVTDKMHEEYQSPAYEIVVPNPIEVRAGVSLDECRSKVRYRIYGMVLYQGNPVVHAVALAANDDFSAWNFFDDDMKVVQFKYGPGERANIEPTKWPAAIFYMME